VSNFVPGDPTTGVFRGYSPGPHSGVVPDPEAYVAPDSIDSRARSALTLGLLSLAFGFVTGVPAIWVGRKALIRINTSDGALRGRWAAWTGIALGCLSVVATIAVWTYFHQRG
jgi:hypothetical protein